MSYILFRYKTHSRENPIQYVKKIHKGKVFFTTYARDAEQFALPKAIFLSLKFHLSWISQKYARR